MKASEDKTYPGAIVAGLDAPWGQSIVANDPTTCSRSGYREVFSRDLYEAWTALYTDGDLATARDTVRYLLPKSQQANGSQPRNSLLDGTKAADAFNDQLDETAYPILMALQSGLASDNTIWPRVKLAANFLISHGPSFGVERWEEQTGYSPSTIAAEIAGLIAAASIADTHGDAASARVWRATADQYQRTIKTWGVTTNGPLSTSPYFIRLSKTGDPNAAISYNTGNGGPTLDQRSIVDAGFLEYVRLGHPARERPGHRELAEGDGWDHPAPDGERPRLAALQRGRLRRLRRRRRHQLHDHGAPVDERRQQRHGPPVAGTRSRARAAVPGASARPERRIRSAGRHQSDELRAGPRARAGVGPANLPRAPYGSDPATASIGFVNGEADGSASPLTWGSASQVRLTADLAAGRSLEQPRPGARPVRRRTPRAAHP